MFVALSGPVVHDHWHDVRLLTESETAAVGRQLAAAGARLVELDSPELEDVFWLCRDWEVLSTVEVVARLESGRGVTVWTGPHRTKSGAEDCADAAWESPGRE